MTRHEHILNAIREQTMHGLHEGCVTTSLVEDFDGPSGGASLTFTPRAAEACPMSVLISRYDTSRDWWDASISLGAGRTKSWFEVWRSQFDSDEEWSAQIVRFLRAIATGSIEQTKHTNGAVRFFWTDGTSSTCGSLLIAPVPWKWRRRTTYPAYS